MTELLLGSARGGKKGAALAPLMIELVRELGEADLPMLVNPPSLGSKPPSLVQLRHNHHELARLLAGGMSSQEAQLITGLSGSRISILRSDPAFCELLKFYETKRELKFIDVLERMKVLGLSSLDEIQSRLEEKPESFSNRELAELSELMLVKGRSGAGGPGGSSQPAGGVNIVIKFPGAESGPIIDGEKL